MKNDNKKMNKIFKTDEYSENILSVIYKYGFFRKRFHSLYSEPVFTAEDAVRAKDFPARQGGFSQEYFVHFKKIQRSMAGKDPPRRRLRL